MVEVKYAKASNHPNSITVFPNSIENPFRPFIRIIMKESTNTPTPNLRVVVWRGVREASVTSINSGVIPQIIFERRSTSCAPRWDDNALKLKILGNELIGIDTFSEFCMIEYFASTYNKI